MLTIAWDVDDILNDLMNCWLTNKWLVDHPGCRVSFEQITENTPERIIKSTKEEYWMSLDSFRLSQTYLDMRPNPEIIAWLERSGEQARHIALTSVPLKAAHLSAEWVIKHLGKWIRSFNFVPSLRPGERLPDYGQSKTDYLKWLGRADILIEDSEQNISEAKELGIKGILVGKPWNKSKVSVKEALEEINRAIGK